MSYHQKLPCNSVRTKLIQGTDDKCFVCTGDTKGDVVEYSCRFQNFRILEKRCEQSGDRLIVSFRESARYVEQTAHLPFVFNRKHTADILDTKERLLAQVLLPVLEKAYAYETESKTQVIRRYRELEVRATCDKCGTSLFSITWLCPCCGREFCCDCHEDMSHSHTKKIHCSTGRVHSEMLPVSRFLEGQLEEALSAMHSCMIDASAEDIIIPTSPSSCYRHVPRIPNGLLLESQFLDQWNRGAPILVTNIHFQVPWNPSYFIERHGLATCTVEDCDDNKEYIMTVAEFFSKFGQDCDNNHKVLKLKDWPPTENFSVIFPELYQDFIQAVPMPDYTSPSGIYNFGAHFPSNGIKPDLGPKMYNALATSQDNVHSGTTRLHMDLSDAINILLFAVPHPDETPGFAVWHMFAPEDADSVRAFLKEQPEYNGIGDPIHGQQFYLTPSMLDALYTTYGIIPYVIHQHPGEAVFIPAGCAHQVSNESDAIKIACDFISPQSLKRCIEISDEFHLQRLAMGWGDDVLQLYTTLWYSWLSLPGLRLTLPKVDVDRMEIDDSISVGEAAANTEYSETVLLMPHEDDTQMTVNLEEHGTNQADTILESTLNSTSVSSKPTIGGSSVARRIGKSRRRHTRREAKHTGVQSEVDPSWVYICPRCPHRRFNADGLLSHMSSHGVQIARSQRKKLIKMSSEMLLDALVQYLS